MSKSFAHLDREGIKAQRSFGAPAQAVSVLFRHVQMALWNETSKPAMGNLVGCVSGVSREPSRVPVGSLEPPAGKGLRSQQ